MTTVDERGAPILSVKDRAFLHGESKYSRSRLAPGRVEELRALCGWVGDAEIHEAEDHYNLVIVKTPDGRSWGFLETILHEETEYDEEPLFLVEPYEVKETRYRKPGGKSLDGDDHRAFR